MRSIVTAATLLLAFATTSSFALTPEETITELDAKFNKLGAPKLVGTEKAGEFTVPALFFGVRKLNNNFTIVDEIKKDHGATATVFVKYEDDFVRVTTNVQTPEGKRGVGTKLARAKAYDAVKKGNKFCGEVDVLGTAFDACYNPIKGKDGSVIGVTYIGYKK